MTGLPYPAPEDDGGAAHLVPGLAMPAIPLAATGGAAIDLSRAPGLSIVFIYPWTGRPGVANPPGWDHIPGAHGSTPELEAARDLNSKFRAAGATVFALSGQPREEQLAFASRVAIPFEILSDETLAFAHALALPTFTVGSATYLKRLTLAMRGGRLMKAFYPVHPPELHPAMALAWLREKRCQEIA